jgi:hypothetical protein
MCVMLRRRRAILRVHGSRWLPRPRSRDGILAGGNYLAYQNGALAPLWTSRCPGADPDSTSMNYDGKSYLTWRCKNPCETPNEMRLDGLEPLAVHWAAWHEIVLALCLPARDF